MEPEPFVLPQLQSIPENYEERATFNWTILGFGNWFPSLVLIQRSNARHQLISTQFIRGQLVKRTSIWELELGMKGSKLIAALGCLHCFHENVEEIWAHFDVDIIDLDGTVLHSEEKDSNLTKFTPRDKCVDKRSVRLANRISAVWETEVIPKIELTKNWNKLVHRDILNLRLKLRLYHEKPLNQSFSIVKGMSNGSTSTAQVFETSSEFISAVKNLWETMEDSDLTIELDGNILPAHKFVLKVQSPVLKEMIKARENLEECTKKETTVIELSGQGYPFLAFELLLRYLYTQNPAELRSSQDVDFLSSVLQTCKRLEVKSLAKICLDMLLKSMTAENFGRTASAIFEHGWIEQSYFRKEVKRFLLENQSAVQGSEEFKSFAKRHPEQFLQICLEPIEPIWLINNTRVPTSSQTN